MTDATPTAATPTPEELAARVGWPHESGMRLCGEKDIAAAIRQHSEALRAENERLTKELAREEATCGDVIDQRDTAEKALSDLFSMVTGRPPEWSNLFGYSEALDECEEALSASLERERGMREALETAMRLVEEYGCRTDVPHIADDCDAAVAMCRAALAKEAADER